jgi:thiol-disulfide isomerase/thioredoxin
MSNPENSSHTPLLVACLCARWCGTCNEYAPLFEQLKTVFPDASVRWIDIEDESDLVDPIEVENFPTVLIATQGQARFFGALVPHLETLRRLIQSLLDTSGPSRLAPEVQQFTQRLATQTAAN